jgi:hypothetical protein
MAKVKEDFKIEMKLKGIEMLNGSLQLPSNQDLNITNFNFNINIESKADAPNKIVFVIVNIEIKNEDQSVILGSISVSCIYEILNFVDVIKISTDGKLDIPQALIEVLNSISISTTRGVMFSTFKGTFLHNAVLPIIDPRQFQFAD